MVDGCERDCGYVDIVVGVVIVDVVSLVCDRVDLRVSGKSTVLTFPRFDFVTLASLGGIATLCH
jgi:uncharacterized membrane protein YcaP (DUF421 family)